jgi:hypothetical protein
MDKELKTYRIESSKQVEHFNSRLIKIKDNERESFFAEVRTFYNGHINRVRDFQHERLIHLIVTLFFAFLLLASAAGGLFALNLAADPSGPMLNLLTWSLCVLLFLTEIFYIRHYYILENGTQSLYTVSKQLQTIIGSIK